MGRMMMDRYDGGRSALRAWLERLKQARLVLAGAAIVFAALWLAGVLAVGPALVGFAAVLAVAAVVAANAGERTSVAAPDERPMARAGDPLLDAVLAGLPDPVVALRPQLARSLRSTHGQARSRPRFAAASRSRSACACPRSWMRSGARARPATMQRVGVFGAGAGRPLVRSRRRRRFHRRSSTAGPDLLLLIVSRSHAATPGRGDARRLRRQCQPRAAHAARCAFRLHRDAAGAGARGSACARPLSRDHAGAGDSHGAPDRRPAVALAHRAQRASAAGQAGRSRRHPPAGRRQSADAWPAIAASRSRSPRHRVRCSCSATATS